LSNQKHSRIQAGSLRVHYFPNISLDQSSAERRREGHENSFQRIHFRNVDTTNLDGPAASETDGVPHKNRNPSCEEIEQNAFQQGFDEGKKVGFEAGSKKLEPVIISLNQALRQLENVRQEIHGQIEKEVVKLAVAIAKKIVCHEIKISPDTVVCVAREAISGLENPGKIKVKMNPVDLQFVQNTKHQLTQILHNVENVLFEAEESIPSGGCIIETDMGDIDARLEKQFQVIEEYFQTQLKTSE
jgi:flagellar biosynthesis/type III secretory pathway protein FliH